jgi:uncharacterized protein
VRHEFDTSVLICAARAGYTELALSHIAAGASLDLQEYDSARTALMFSAEKGHTEIAESLIAAGAAIEVKDDYDQTALILATLKQKQFRGQKEIALSLIAAGA